MGLVANVLEDRGVSTVCLSTIPPLTRGTGAPRVVGISYPMGVTMGRPGDADGQRDVLQRTLEAAAAMTQPRRYHELSDQWPEPRSVAIRHPHPPPPIVSLLRKKPWLLPRLISGQIP